ncbi:MAG: replication and repair protein RecF, DNA replication and repair protein RecF protein [Candidatus Peregrinibacteria bacterium GW2011_GWF2_33_10]|nr:MAG: replication and repair protein RecF, DNA replication and repair protein RecF protein [Candidatus Peregrinibacteria bacterium GW2011_GWF2_33_10]OGJ44220.1 MAG: hypothetical protein A2263_04570 [Candidatus Peregrinibacteria bacterium RIFOXYA2_FULL_33_21]OGJ46704.1 MAG: hypothetical protein A2272_04830 [Candidatus Peregrinibacteria bacterium RIFOXYA12_FULL_33_12]OGJ51849.1 MAG: hypothetical protein A2307_05235 [Candidatus Peregrinibacteria bacterium RIFOXYB2_FULL_33_20]
MFIKSLKLENFRNHKNLSLEFNDKGFNVFYGRNGLGKTNVLEAIYVLALTKSFHSVHPKELISWGADFFRLKGQITSDRDYEVEFFYQNEPNVKRAIKKSGINISIKKYLGSILVSFFSPEELNLIYLEPLRRRKYLNIVLSQIYPEYLEALMRYEKALIQRNRLLNLISDNKASVSDLESWDRELVLYGNRITESRKKFFKEIFQDMNEFYKKISGGNDDLQIKYKFSENLEKDLKNSLKEDLARRITSHGAHREDFEFYLNDHLASHFGSRGECRTIILALKLAERNFFKKQMKFSPIILLDDVLSELDHERQNHLLHLISGSQVFLTTSREERDLPDARNMHKILLGVV